MLTRVTLRPCAFELGSFPETPTDFCSGVFIDILRQFERRGEVLAPSESALLEDLLGLGKALADTLPTPAPVARPRTVAAENPSEMEPAPLLSIATALGRARFLRAVAEHLVLEDTYDRVVPDMSAIDRDTVRAELLPRLNERLIPYEQLITLDFLRDRGIRDVLNREVFEKISSLLPQRVERGLRSGGCEDLVLLKRLWRAHHATQSEGSASSTLGSMELLQSLTEAVLLGAECGRNHQGILQALRENLQPTEALVRLLFRHATVLDAEEFEILLKRLPQRSEANNAGDDTYSPPRRAGPIVFGSAFIGLSGGAREIYRAFEAHEVPGSWGQRHYQVARESEERVGPPQHSTTPQVIASLCSAFGIKSVEVTTERQPFGIPFAWRITGQF